MGAEEQCAGYDLLAALVQQQGPGHAIALCEHHHIHSDRACLHRRGGDDGKSPSPAGGREHAPEFRRGQQRTVQIVSDVPIVAAERLIYKVNNVATSFTEMMALPDSQLDTSYWLPWYNNVDLDTAPVWDTLRPVSTCREVVCQSSRR